MWGQGDVNRSLTPLSNYAMIIDPAVATNKRNNDKLDIDIN